MCSTRQVVWDIQTGLREVFSHHWQRYQFETALLWLLFGIWENNWAEQWYVLWWCSGTRCSTPGLFLGLLPRRSALKSHHEGKPLRNLSSMVKVNVMQEWALICSQMCDSAAVSRDSWVHADRYEIQTVVSLGVFQKFAKGCSHSARQHAPICSPFTPDGVSY